MNFTRNLLKGTIATGLALASISCGAEDYNETEQRIEREGFADINGGIENIDYIYFTDEESKDGVGFTVARIEYVDCPEVGIETDWYGSVAAYHGDEGEFIVRMLVPKEGSGGWFKPMDSTELEEMC